LSNEEDRALEEYKLLVDLAVYEGNTYWARFNVHFAINAALVGAIGFLAFQPNSSSQLSSSFAVFAGILSAFGFVASSVWLLNSLRAHIFYEYWFRRMRAIEQTSPIKESKFLKIVTELGEHFDTMKARQSILRVPIMTASYLISGSFLVGYVGFPLLVLSLSLCQRFLVVGVEVLVFILFLVYGFKKHKGYEKRRQEEKKNS
jgi:hypothetical protein